MFFTIFMALAIFGGTVTLIDLLMGLGHDGDHGGGGHGSDHGSDHSLESDSLHHGNPGSEVLTPSQDHFDGTMKLQDRDPGSGLYRAVAFLRRSVYFSLGAGAAGLAALVTGSGELVSLLWATATGAASLGILSLVKRLQSKELDSTVSEEELLYEEGEVVVTILPGQIGKIRLKGKGSMIERYAKAEDPLRAFRNGDQIKVSDVKEDMVLVVPMGQELR